MLTKAVLIFLGGGVGCVCRWVIASAADSARIAEFPYATLVVNALGCFAAGVLVHVLGEHFEVRTDHHALLMVGFLGGFTTFSSYARESLELLVEGDWLRALANMAIMNIVCLGAVLAGFAIARTLWTVRWCLSWPDEPLFRCWRRSAPGCALPASPCRGCGRPPRSSPEHHRDHRRDGR